MQRLLSTPGLECIRCLLTHSKCIQRNAPGPKAARLFPGYRIVGHAEEEPQQHTEQLGMQEGWPPAAHLQRSNAEKPTCRLYSLTSVHATQQPVM